MPCTQCIHMPTLEPCGRCSSPFSHGLCLWGLGKSVDCFSDMLVGRSGRAWGGPGTVRIGGPGRLGSSWRGHRWDPCFLLQTAASWAPSEMLPQPLGPLMQTYLLLVQWSSPPPLLRGTGSRGRALMTSLLPAA